MKYTVACDDSAKVSRDLVGQIEKEYVRLGVGAGCCKVAGQVAGLEYSDLEELYTVFCYQPPVQTLERLGLFFEAPQLAMAYPHKSTLLVAKDKSLPGKTVVMTSYESDLSKLPGSDIPKLLSNAGYVIEHA